VQRERLVVQGLPEPILLGSKQQCLSVIFYVRLRGSERKMARVVLGEAQQDLELIREVGHSATSYDLLEAGGALAKVGIIHISESYGVIPVDCDQISEGELHNFIFVICDFLTISNGADRNATVDVTGQVRLTEELGRRSRSIRVEGCDRK
jgi:hypothetical protein